MAKIEKNIKDLNVYDYFRPVYDSNSLKLKAENRIGSVEIGGETKYYKRGHTVSEYTPWLKSEHHDRILLGDFLTDYINREDVRKALNIPDSIQAWEDCSSIDYTALAKGSYWIYENLRGKYRMLVYSGDTDGAVATWGTKYWIDKLNWPILGKWRPWFTND